MDLKEIGCKLDSTVSRQDPMADARELSGSVKGGKSIK